MSEANAVLDFLDQIAMRSGGLVLALCAIAVIAALARGWLYGPRYVKLIEALLAEEKAELKALESQRKGTKQ